MQLVCRLVCCGLTQVLGEGAARLVDVAGDHLRDNTRALPRALARASDRAWQALALALAGEGLFAGLTGLFAGGDAKAVREQLRPFLDRCAAQLDQTPAAFRKACLAELNAIRQRGLLSSDGVTADDLRPAFSADVRSALDAAGAALSGLADALAADCPNLAALLRRNLPGGPPLLVAAFAFFFRREVETDDQLSRGLAFDAMRKLSADQAEGFAALERGLEGLGGRFDEVIGQLGRIEGTAAATHGAVLDLRAELDRLGRGQRDALGEMRRLVEELGRHRVSAPPRVGGRQHEGPLGMAFAWLPPGAFLMGSPPEEKQRRTDETPHAVTFARGFYLARHPVTRAQWRAVMCTEPGLFRGDSLPVEGVSWDDCRAFCRRLGETEGGTYRLPTEAEWEYACRAGSAGPYGFGAALTAAQATFAAAAPTPVGSHEANAWGLYDLHGNVFEWCSDWYGDYPEALAADPSGPADGDARVLRGGSWFSAACYCRSAYRHWADPGVRSAHFGFRLVFCPEGEAKPRWTA